MPVSDIRDSTIHPASTDLAIFYERVRSDAACLLHLKELRWGADLERFCCPNCGSSKGWWLDRRQLAECRVCGKQSSVTAGTVFHRVRTSLRKWFCAVYLLHPNRKRITTMELAKLIHVSYATAWLMLKKLRSAMGTRIEDYGLERLMRVNEAGQRQAASTT